MNGDKTIADHAIAYGSVFLSIVIMLLFLLLALFFAGFLVEENADRLVARFGADSEILFYTSTGVWFLLPFLVAAVVASICVTSAIISASPLASRAATQSIDAVETAPHFQAYGGFARLLHDWLTSGINEPDPNKYLLAYWPRMTVQFAKIATILFLFSVFLFWIDANTYKSATDHGFVVRQYGALSERNLAYIDLDRIEAGCRIGYKRGKPKTWLRYELIFKSGDKFDVYRAQTRGSRLAKLEKMDLLATNTDIPVIHTHQINEKIKLSNSDIETGCAKRVIDFYSEPNEKRAFRLLRFSERS